MNIVEGLVLRPVQRFVAGVQLNRTKYGNSEKGFLACIDDNNLEIFKLFLIVGVNVNAADDHKETALMKASRQEPTTILSLLLDDQNLDVNAQTLSGDTALITACRSGKLDAIRLLLGDERLDPNAKNALEETALMIACRAGELDAIRLLLGDKRLDPNAKNALEETALLIASQHNTKAMALLLAHPAIGLNAQDHNGDTVLMFASRVGNIEVVQLLLGKKGLDLNISNKEVHSALYQARAARHQVIEDLLIQAGADRKAVARQLLCERNIEFEAPSFFDQIRAKDKNLYTIALFLEAGMNSNERAPDGGTPLILAAGANWIDGARLLIKAGADINASRKDGMNAFISAVRTGSSEMVLLLLEEKRLDLNAETSAGETALTIACKNADLGVLKVILKDDRLDINAQNSQGDTALLISCRLGLVNAVEELLGHANIAVNQPDKHGNPALLLSAAGGNLELGKRLLAHPKIEVDLTNEAGECALYKAIDRHYHEFEDLLLAHRADKRIAARKILQEMGIDLDEEVFFEAVRAWDEGRVTLLLDAGMDPNRKDASGNPPLILAAEMRSFPLAQILKDHGADLNVRNHYGASALMVAASTGYQELVDWLKEQGADESGLHETMIFRAIELGDIKELESILAGNPRLNFRNHLGEFPLSVSVRLNRFDVLTTLLEKGAQPVDARDADGKTALMKAAEKNLSDVIDLLIRHRANINEKSSVDGKTALILAAEGGLAAMVEQLLKHGADANIEDTHGWTALTAAVLRRHRHIEEKLRPLTREDIVSTLLTATRRGDLATLKAALSKADLPNTSDEEGNSLLMIAAQYGWSDVVAELLQHKIVIDAKNKTGDTALILAARAGQLEVVEKLLDEKLTPRAQLDTRNYRRNTALIEAARHSRPAVVIFLLAKGADPSLAGEDRTTALLETSYLGSFDAVQALLARKTQQGSENLKAFLNSESKYGHTPLMTAILAGHTQIARFLKEKGAEKGENEAALFFAARSGNVGEIKALKDKVKINVFDKEGSTPLLDAVERGSLAAVDALIEMDARITATSQQGRSALSTAAAMGRIDILDALLPQVGDEEFLPTAALLAAARQGQVKVVHFLLKETKAKVDGVVPKKGKQSESEDNMRILGVPLVSAAANGHYEVVSVLLANDADVNRKDLLGQTALAYAILNGHERIAKLLREHGADEESARNASLIEAARRGDLQKIEDLLQFDLDLNVGDREGRSALIWAAAKGRYAAVRRLIDHKPDKVEYRAKIELASTSKRTALLEACRGGTIKIVQCLLEAVAEDTAKLAEVVDVEDNYGNTPLKEALLNDHKEIARILETHYATKGRNEAEILEAAKYGRTDDLARLIQADVDINTTDLSGKTPLMLAAENGNTQAVRLLVVARAGVDQQSRTGGETALILATKSGYRDIVQILLDARANANEAPRKGRTALIEAAEAGYFEIAESLIVVGAAVNLKGSGSETALIVAVRRGHEEIVQLLLNANADVDVITAKGWTALMEAADGNHANILKALLAKGADVNLADEEGTTALMLAVRQGAAAIVAALAEVKTLNFDRADGWGRTALTLAHLRSILAAVSAAELFVDEDLAARLPKNASPIERSLLNNGARKGWNEAELILAAYARQSDYIRKLVKEHVFPDVRDLEHTRTALAVACILGDRQTVEVLLEAGADPNLQGDDARTPLLHAIRHAHPEIALLLIERGIVHPDIRDENGDTAIHEAARGGYNAVLQALIVHNARQDMSNNYGRTALMEAAYNGYLEILQTLLPGDGSENTPQHKYASAVDERGRTALDLAIAAGYTDCIKFLKSKNAPTARQVGLMVYVTLHGHCYHRMGCKAITGARTRGELEAIKLDQLETLTDDRGVPRKLYSCGICDPEASKEEIVIHPRKILFLAANPTDTAHLRLDEEVHAIDLAIRRSEYRDYFDIKQHWSVRISEIQECLLRHCPEIVHFSGHGWQTGEIVLVDDNGHSDPLNPEAVGNLFQLLKGNIQCVILNACYTETLALKVAEHIDFVIGLPTEIEDTAAIGFANAFYQALGYGHDYQKAFELGCNQIKLESTGRYFASPKLFQRSDFHILAS